MIIDSTLYNGACACGRSHEMATKEAVIEPGCLKQLPAYARKHGLTGPCAVVYDENTYCAVNMVHPEAYQEIILPAANLHADEHAVGLVLARLKPEIRYLVAVGGGTIHDTTRYCAHARNIPFVACPTAASVDGFCSTISAMTWQGFKKTMPGVAPTLVLADIDIIKEAPLRLNLSGAGDIFGKYTALADWKIANLLTGEYFCPTIEAMTRNAVDAVRQGCQKLAQKDTESVTQLTYALILSGLAMQMMGNSRPASGCEHHISHLLEMNPAAFPFHSSALHGEKVGVGTILASEEFHRLTEITDISGFVQPYAFPEQEKIRSFYGEALWTGTLEENKNDCMAQVSQEKLISAWPQIRQVIAQIPAADQLRSLYAQTGIRSTLEEIGVPDEYLGSLLDYSPTARNRLTMMRVRWMINA